VNALRRLVALTAVLGTLSIAVAGTTAGLVATALASGGGACEGVAAGPTPGPTQVLASHFSGVAAAASFTSVTGTTETDVGVDAFDGTVTLAAGSGPTSIDAVFVAITVSDTVTGIQSVEAFGCTPAPDFQIDQTLTLATLAPTAVTVQDTISDTFSTATVSADWTGVGNETRTTQVSHFHSGAFTTTFSFIGFDRLADATGTVDNPELGETFDGTATFAELDNVRDGGVNVCVGGSC
jgi:hypothetical protein